MGEWFNERYISRDEHKNIVAYYRKLVAKLHCNVRDLRAKVASGEQPGISAAVTEPEAGRIVAATPDGSNVVILDFRRKP